MPRLLLVDDDDSFRTMLRITLARLGYPVTEAVDGHAAVQKQDVAPSDILITDLIMPDQEGLETIRKFRLMFPSVKIIAMSGGGRIRAEDFLKIAKIFGASRVLAKPFATEELVAAIEELWATARAELMITAKDAQP